MTAADDAGSRRQRRRGLRDLYHASSFHHWRLGRHRAQALLVEPHDPWPGDPDAGRALIDGRFTLLGRHLDLGEVPWMDPLDDRIEDSLHGFGWLRDLRDTGGDAARARARTLVSSWIDAHDRWDPETWRGDVLGTRVGNWIGLHDFFCASADDAFEERFFASLSRQAAHLKNDWRSAPDGAGRLAALRGRVMATATLGSSVGGTMDAALSDSMAEIDHQIATDGGHASRSPALQVEGVRNLIDIRAILRAASYPVPGELDDAIYRMSTALRLFRHPDGGLALFHGATETTGPLIDVVLARSEGKRRSLTELPDTGYHRLTAGRTIVIIDGSRPAATDGMAHASPLAFEMSVGRQRLVVNCGTSPGERKWESALRATAAHSTLVLDDRNAAEIASDGTPGARPARVTLQRGEDDDGSWVEGEHDGYVPTHGLLHHRRLSLSEGGDAVGGIDTLFHAMGATALGQASAETKGEVALRFHLHPRVGASVVQSGASVLLRMPNGAGWRLRADVPARLNESVYFGSNGRLQRAEQIILSATTHDITPEAPLQIRWSIVREDGGKAG